MRKISVLSAIDGTTYKHMMQVLVCLLLVLRSEDQKIAPYLWQRITKHKDNGREFFLGLGSAATAFTSLTRAATKNAPYPEDEVADFLSATAEHWDRIKLNRKLMPDQISLLANTLRYLKRQPDTAYAHVVKHISLVGDPSLSQLVDADFSDSDTGQELHATDLNSVKKALRVMVKKYSRTVGEYFPEDQRAQIKVNYPDAYKQYLGLHKQLKDSFKTRLRTLVRDTGDTLIDTDEVIRVMRTLGVPHNIPDGFVGKVDDQARLYTSGGLRIASYPRGKVLMNPQYRPKEDNTYVFTAQAPGAAKPQRYYTEDWSKRRAGQKFEKTSDFIKDLKKMAVTWRKDLKSGKGARKMLGLIVEIMYITSARIGSKTTNATAGARTVGITTWSTKHLRRVGTGYRVSYVGKSGVKQTHLLRADMMYSKIVVQELEKLVAERERDEFLFTVLGTSNRWRRITSTEVNNYLRTISGGGVTAKTFRTARGTVLFQEKMNASPIFSKAKTPTDKEARDAFARILLEVGKELGHYTTGPDGSRQVTGATAMRNYVHVDVMNAYWNKLNMRPPPAIEKVLGQQNAEE